MTYLSITFKPASTRAMSFRFRSVKTSAPICLDGIPPLMRTRELEPYNAPIIQRIALETPEARYINSVEKSKYGPELRYAAYAGATRSELKPHWAQDGIFYSHVSVVGSRPKNEDVSLYLPDCQVFAIFDGWGGRTSSHQAALFLEKAVHDKKLFSFPNNHLKDKADMITAFRDINSLFRMLGTSEAIEPEYVYSSTEPARARGSTAVIATVSQRSVTVGSLGDAEAYVFDASTGQLALPTYFEAHDTQTDSVVHGQYAAATVPHGFEGVPHYTEPGNFETFSHFQHEDQVSAIEEHGKSALFEQDPGQREYNIARALNDGVHPGTENVNNTSRLLGSADPRRSVGEISDEWDRQYHMYKPLVKPEIHTWRFADGFHNKWLMLCCDGLYNNNAFRGPYSVCAFLMDPFHFLAFELERSGNLWFQLLVKKSQADPANTKSQTQKALDLKTGLDAFLEFTRTKMRCFAVTPSIDEQRPLLAAYFDHLYRLAALCPAVFYSDNIGSDSIHQAALFFMQWTSFGKIGGLAGHASELNPEDLIAALAYLCGMLYSSDNISISLVKLDAKL